MTSFLIVLFATFILSSVASGQIIVAKDGTGTHTTITDAINAADDYDEILVMPGKYPESIKLSDKKYLTIIGKGEVWIEPKGEGAALSLAECYQLNFKGINFKNGIDLKNCEDTEISSCLFKGSKSGINVAGSQGIKIFGNTFSKCVSSAITLNDCRGIRVINNLMYEITAKDIILLTASEADIKNNTIAYNQGAPISIGDNCERSKIRNNIICFNTVNGDASAIDSKTDTDSYPKISVEGNNVFQNKNAKGVAPKYSGLDPKHDLSVDPIFTDADRRVFTLKDSSPCIGIGEFGINLGVDFHSRESLVDFEEKFDDAVAEFKVRKYAQSIESFKKLLLSYQGNTDLWNALGDSYLAMKQFGEAIAAFQKSLKIKPKDGIACFNLACAFSLQGKTTEGLEWLEKAVNSGALDYTMMKDEPGIELLRKTDEYKKLMKKFEYGGNK